MDKKKLNAKDFINIGIFTVIYFVMFFITGMLGYIPIFAVIIPLVLGILGGIPFMLFLTKTGKFGAATIMSERDNYRFVYCPFFVIAASESPGLPRSWRPLTILNFPEEGKERWQRRAVGRSD